MGLSGLPETGDRAEHFRAILTGLGTHARGSPEWMAEAFLKTTGGDPEALLRLLGSFVDTTRRSFARSDSNARLQGAEDDDNGSAEDLAALLPDAASSRFPAII